jgi:hypothetical protein
MTVWRSFTGMVILLVGVLGGTVQAELYTWTDDQGNVHLSDVPPNEKKAKRFTVDKGCTLLKHVPGMTHNDLSRFMGNMFNGPYKREDMKGEYRDLFDDVSKTNAACNMGDYMACECFHGRAETKGMTFAPVETENIVKGKGTQSEGGRRSGPTGRLPKQP